MLNRIDHGFTDAQFDPMSHFVVELVFLYSLLDQGVHSIHLLDPARNRQLETPPSFCSHCLLVTRGLCKVNAVLISAYGDSGNQASRETEWSNACGCR